MPDIRIKTAEGTAAGNGSITGYASTWTREPDSYGDVVAKGAFAKSLARIADEGRTLPLLWNHDAGDLKSYIGTVTDLAEDERGLLFSATFDATPEAQRARELAMDGRLCKFSFAYDVIDQMEVELEDGRKANELRELDIHEVSLVMYPANPDTSVVEVKGAQNIGTVTVNVVPQLDEEKFACMAKAIENGLKTKYGRRNSKTDETALNDALAHVAECMDEVGELLSKLGAVHDALSALVTDDTPDEGDQIDADDQGDTTEGGEGEAAPKGREVEAAKVEAYRNAILNQKEGNHA